jgi:aminotransferase
MTRPLTSKRAQTLPYSGIREIFDLAATMDDVIHLEIGEPDFQTPKAIIEAAHRAALDGATHYTSSAGLLPLRERAAAALSSQLNVPYSADEIVITAGGMEALLLSTLVTLNAGDELLLPSPHWPNYPAHALLAGAHAVTVPLSFDDGYRPSIEVLERRVTPRTRALLLNYPHNPTGAVLEENDLETLAAFAREHDLLVYSDEAYERLLFDGRGFRSIASLPGMKERTIVLRTFSKTYAMTGWRVGFLAAATPVATKAARLHEHTSACTSAVSQRAALAALDLPDRIPGEMVASYEHRRDLLIEGLRRVPGFLPFVPQGTFYTFVDIRALGRPSQELARRLLEDARVAVAPGAAFGEEGEGYIRLCFANSEVHITEGVQRIRNVLSHSWQH